MSYALDHEEYAELCALSTSGSLSSDELLKLRDHLSGCPDCRQAYREYYVLTSEIIPSLAQIYEASDDHSNWDNMNLRSRVLAGLDRETVASSASLSKPWQRPRFALLAAMAASLLVVVGIAAYKTGIYRGIRSPIVSPAPVAQVLTPPIANQSLESQLRDSLAAIGALQRKNSKEQAEADKLQSRIHELDARISEINAMAQVKDEQAQALISERDALAQQLRDAQDKYKAVEDELVLYRSQQRDAQLRTASLESEVERLSNQLSEQEKAVQERDEYLASDRDIRELMGARHLYIADVYDIDKNGHSRKAYGRVFYTVDKSLVFYAFDLDQGASLKNSTFQAWGRKDLGPEKPVESLDLGIFYMDSAANRRWVLRSNDPAKIAQIDAIFVTAEPGGGSQKPSGKPFLFASLRQPPNHP
jgi:hypothetical protein